MIRLVATFEAFKVAITSLRANKLRTALTLTGIIVGVTAVTPTTMPIKVSAVRSLFARRLAVATRNASQMAVKRRSISHKTLTDFITHQKGFCFGLLNSLVFFDETVANRDHAVGAGGDVVLVSDDDDRVAFRVETLEEVHDFHAGV